MVIVVPVTGTARCGKTILMEQLSNVLLRTTDENFNCSSAFTIDSSAIAKAFLDGFADSSPRYAFNKAMKTDKYRQALVDIIKALDNFDLRVSNLTDTIMQYAMAHPNKSENHVIFINIREITVIAKLVSNLSYLSDDSIRCITLICSRPSQTEFVNNESDSADFLSQAKKKKLNYAAIEIPEVKGLGKTENVDVDDARLYDAFVKETAKKIIGI